MKSFLFFLLKVVLIEWAVELCRYIIYMIRYRKLPDQFFMTHTNTIFHYVINISETIVVATLLYYGMNIYAIIGITLLTTYCIQTLGKCCVD